MSRFKVGDKVRYKSVVGLWYEHRLTDGLVGEVIGRGLCENEVFVNFSDMVYSLPIDNLELVAPTDPKREFLERLQSLMREFNASINMGWNEYFDSDKCPCIDMDITFGDGRGICFSNVLDYTITADNIMDYDKE